MKHGANTYGRPTKHAGALNFKQTQIQDLNAPSYFKSSPTYLRIEPIRMDFPIYPAVPPIESAKE